MEIPKEWRVKIDTIAVPGRPLPNLPKKTVENSQSLSEKLSSDVNFQSVPIVMDKAEIDIQTAAALKEQISDCLEHIEKAEFKRREIASNAELIHGECNSQISDEQRLSVFVKSIDSILRYYDDLNRIQVDFMAPPEKFSVLTPDFQIDLNKIEKGIQFFEMNPNYREAKVYLLKYQSLQVQAVERIKEYISNSFSTSIQSVALARKRGETNSESKIYGGFRNGSESIKRLFRLSEKTPAFGDVLNIYKSVRVTLLAPLIGGLISGTSEVGSKGRLVISYVTKEYDLARDFFDFNGHPLYLKCFTELVTEMGQMFYDSCCSIVVKSNDIRELCNVCIVLKGDNLQDEITRVPLAAEKLRIQINRLLSSVQERLLFRVEISTKEIVTDSNVTMETISLLSLALPSESFGETACNLLTACLDSLKNSAKQYGQFEGDIYLLSHYLTLREKMKTLNGNIVGTTQVIDFEPVTDFLKRLLRFDASIYQLGGDRGFMRSVVGLSRVVSSSVDGRKQLESSTSLCFQSVASYATQVLTQPLLNLKARGGKEKGQMMSAIEGVNICINEHFKSEITDIVRKHISDKGHLSAVEDVLHGHLIQVIDDCVKSFGDMDEETGKAIDQLKERISALTVTTVM